MCSNAWMPGCSVLTVLVLVQQKSEMPSLWTSSTCTNTKKKVKTHHNFGINMVENYTLQ